MDLLGKQVDSYRILALLGRGGTSEVYQAHHAALDRQVAFKILLREASQDREWVRRFQQEAHILGRLDHPHILPIYDAGEYQGRPYLVTKFVADGVTLRSQLKGQPWPIPRVLTILEQVAEALGAAHRAGIVHRDVKPSNILVTPDGRCMVFDFGIAKPFRHTDIVTGDGFIVGTPEFMSPEQCRGDKIDHRSDVYALGVMTYQMLTGRVPFTAEAPVGVLMKHLTAPLPVPPKGVELPAEVNDVLRRALARSPRDRYSSVKDLMTALHRAAGRAPTVTLASGTVRTPFWKQWMLRVHDAPRRAVGAVASFALGLGLIGFLLARHASVPEVEIASQPPSHEAGETRSASEANLSAPAPSGKEGRRIVIKSGTQAAAQWGRLSIESDRPAQVTLDGRPLGRSPGVFPSLPPGPHRLTLDAGGGTTWEKEVFVLAASTTYVRMSFLARTEPDPPGDAGRTAPVAGVASAPTSTLSSARDEDTLPAATPARPEARRWKGYLTDEQCRELGGQQGALHLKSALRCIREGWRPMLYTEDGNLHFIDGLERITLHEEGPLVFWGWLDPDTNTIRVK